MWTDLAEAFNRLSDVGYDVIVDAGRLGSAGLPTALVEHAAQTCLVLRSNLRAVMSARVHLATLRDHPRLSETGGGLDLIIVGESEPYSRSEITKALGVSTLGVANDQRAAAHLSDGKPRPRKFNRSALITSLADLTAMLAARLERSADLIRS